METIHLSDKEFKKLKTLIYSISGIKIHSGKMELLKSKISKRMRMTRLSLTDYLKLLYSSKEELVEFIDTVTTNHSYFFRENNSIAHIIKSFTQSSKHLKRYNIWCAAASTGDEPYSVAIQMKQAGLDFRILATDISHSVLETALRGIYRKDKIRKIPRPVLQRYFKKGTGKYEGYFKVKKEIQEHINFKKFNLISDIPEANGFDAVLCRNVMIYFDQQTSQAVVNKLYQTVLTDGFFAIGNAESLMNMKHNFFPVRAIPSLYIKN